MSRGVLPISRRALVKGGAALAATALVRCARGAETPDGGARLTEMRLQPEGALLTAAERPLMLPNGAVAPAWLYGAEPFPVLRVRAGEPVRVTLANELREHTSIHWHGLRIPNAMDGVPYVTQAPVLPGERFSYEFTPSDPGLFIFHPHCNTAEQFGRGLAGVLIVEGGETEPFDDDVLCVLRDWRVAPDGSFLPFITAEGAARAGSFGDLRTANLRVAPDIAVPAGADVRLRLANLDPTRIGEIGIEGAETAVIAIDGNAVAPFAFESWRLGPAMRLELAIRTPLEGERVRLLDYFAAEPVTLATLVPVGSPRGRTAFAPPALRLPRRPEPDLARAAPHELRLSASAVATEYAGLAPIVLPDGRKIDLFDALCSNTRTLWALDGKSWPEQGHRTAPPPILRFARGETALIELFNGSRQPHPMHLHGHSFKVLSASVLARPVHWADTVLVMPDERVRIAFVADNPGNWMLHCHIIEHQDTGMMAWFEVA